MKYDKNYAEYQSNRSNFRKIIRAFYMRAAARKLVGRTLDFGCGLGDLLRLLPEGSRGLEYNEVAVQRCKAVGLDVELYDGFSDDWQLGPLQGGSKFESMIVSHVLEHLDEPAEVLRKLLQAAERLCVSRFVVIVPGMAGFLSDPTHRKFVNIDLLRSPALLEASDFSLRHYHYFPLDARWIGDYLPHHELQVVYER